jgi:biopolymer transport protein ExbD
MKLSRSVHIHPFLFSLVPLVNVVFLLLIFYGLSSNFVLQPGLLVSLPVSKFSLGPQNNPQIVSIISGPPPAIYYNQQKLSFKDLVRSLGANRVKDRSLIIKADRSTPYDLVVQIMNEGLRMGFSVVLATTPEK